jgi:hypothetical protein
MASVLANVCGLLFTHNPSIILEDMNMGGGENTVIQMSHFPIASQMHYC